MNDVRHSEGFLARFLFSFSQLLRDFWFESDRQGATIDESPQWQTSTDTESRQEEK
jgi:hypothetical protein